MLYSCKSGSIRAKVVVFGPYWLFSGKNCCIRAKVVVFGQRGCTRAKMLFSDKKGLCSLKS